MQLPCREAQLHLLRPESKPRTVYAHVGAAAVASLRHSLRSCPSCLLALGCRMEPVFSTPVAGLQRGKIPPPLCWQWPGWRPPQPHVWRSTPPIASPLWQWRSAMAHPALWAPAAGAGATTSTPCPQASTGAFVSTPSAKELARQLAQRCAPEQFSDQCIFQRTLCPQACLRCRTQLWTTEDLCKPHESPQQWLPCRHGAKPGSARRKAERPSRCPCRNPPATSTRRKVGASLG
mmetsp:Transcript_53325/g.116381  ORF Transcript_53325/g.116381 Transcript_53325/m.116381 type:complete len:234 (+) Transcript_53325:183-884(+)